jgi:RNase H-fold protein (predicted Holliday junction resolvase)
MHILALDYGTKRIGVAVSEQFVSCFFAKLVTG